MSSNTQNIIRLTAIAVSEVKKMLDVEKADAGLRLGVKGGGCSGLSYVIKIDESKESDIVEEQYGFKIFVDKKSSLYLKDVILDYNNGLSDRGFKFKNPNAINTCGCGESFSV